MKKVKFYFVFSLIVVFLSVIGILLGMVLVTIEQKHPEYLSAGIFKGIIIFFMALLVTVCVHELVDIRGQGISDHQHVFHIPAAHFLEAVFKILRLRLLARGLLGNKNVLKIPVQARLAQTVVLGGRNAVGYDIKLILAL